MANDISAVSHPQAQETRQDILMRLAHYMEQWELEANKWEARALELSTSLNNERAAHEATRQELEELSKALVRAAGDYVSIERQLGETQLVCHTLQAALTEAEAKVERVRQAWDRLCACVDEFEPEDMGACSEYRDMLDSALIGLLTESGVRDG